MEKKGCLRGGCAVIAAGAAGILYGALRLAELNLAQILDQRLVLNAFNCLGNPIIDITLLLVGYKLYSSIFLKHVPHHHSRSLSDVIKGIKDKEE